MKDKSISKYKFLGLALALVGMAGLLVVKPVSARLSAPVQFQTDPAINVDYIQVYNSDNVAHEVGDVVVYKVTAGLDGIGISTTTTANNSLVAGVIAQRDCAAATYCTVQVYGYNATITIAATVSAGDALVTSTTGEGATPYTFVMSTGSLAGQATSYAVFGISLVGSTGTTTQGFIFR